MRRITKILFLLLIAGPLLVFAQENNFQKQTAIEEAVEFFGDQFGEDSDYSVIVEDLEYFSENPINLNQVTAEQLERLHFLSSYTIQSILDYRSTYGEIYSPYELIAVKGISEELLQQMLPFVTAGPDEPDKKEMQYADHQIIGRVQHAFPSSVGYQPGSDTLPAPYPGTPYKYYLRYSLSVNDKIKAGFTGENDAGEEFLSGSNPGGFDFYSAYASFSGEKWLKNLVVGDYHMRMGQGLILWTGWGKSKSAEVLSVRNTGQGTRGYTSTDENRFLRGIAAELRTGRYEFQLFYSNHKADGTIVINEDEEEVNESVSSLQSSGLHRTESERKNEKSVRERFWGGALKFRHEKMQLGLNGTYHQIHPCLAEKEKPYQQFQFHGDENYNISLDHYFQIGKTSFFGEYALCKSKGTAFLEGMETQLISEFRLVALYRNYQKNFHALFGDPFAESHGYNESGWYFGTVILPLPKLKLSLYYDFYEHPWLTYSTNSPSQGQDILAQLDWQINKNAKMYFRIKNERKEVKTSVENGIAPDIYTEKSNVRWNLATDVSQDFSLRSRIEYVVVGPENQAENGWLLFQDFAWHPANMPLSLTFRVALFDTDSYASSIYAYENDLLYNYSIPAYFGSGTRYYLNARYSFAKNIDLWVKLADTQYFGQTTIGSGKDQVEGDWKADVKFQVRMRF